MPTFSRLLLMAADCSSTYTCLLSLARLAGTSSTSPLQLAAVMLPLTAVPHFPVALSLSVKVKMLKRRPAPLLMRQLSRMLPLGSSSTLHSSPDGSELRSSNKDGRAEIPPRYAQVSPKSSE